MLARDTSPHPEFQAGDDVPDTGPGSLVCVGCGFAYAIAATDSLPRCPHCGGEAFRHASLFDRPTVDDLPVTRGATATEWLEEARAELDRPGSHLAFEDADGDLEVVRLEPGWTRIGRSAAADIRLEDPTVSRRHALVVLTDDGDLRALDDRSLNGLFVNGEGVEWAPLGDGDVIDVGRYRLHVLIA